jgi:exonuclease SbcD
VILISGNHDSARRLGFSSTLIDAAGVHLRTRMASLADPVPLADDHGPVAVYGIPYLEPAVSLPDADPVPAAGQAAPAAAPRAGAARGHQAVLGEAVRRVRADAASRGAPRTVVLAHGWVTGGQASDSERDIRVGGVGDVPASLFDGISYVALGHLHGQQTLADRLRYSGSPLPYSFSEARHKKGTWLVELGEGGKISAERVPAPAWRRLSLLRGQLDELLADARYASQEGDFLAVTLTDTARPVGAMDRLRRRFPHVLTLEFDPEGLSPDQRSYRARVAGRDDLTVAAEFIRHVRDTEPTQGERDLLAAAFTAARGADDQNGDQA